MTETEISHSAIGWLGPVCPAPFLPASPGDPCTPPVSCCKTQPPPLTDLPETLLGQKDHRLPAPLASFIEPRPFSVYQKVFPRRSADNRGRSLCSGEGEPLIIEVA